MTNILTVSSNAWGKFCSINGIKINLVDTSFLKSRLDVHNCHGLAPDWIEHFPKLILRQCLSPSVKVPFTQIPLPQFFNLGKGCGVKYLYNAASMFISFIRSKNASLLMWLLWESTIRRCGLSTFCGFSTTPQNKHHTHKISV